MTIPNDTRRNDYYSNVASLAKAEGQGANSRPEFGRVTFIAAADGVISGGKEEGNDVTKVHMHYQSNVAKKFTGTAPLQDDNSLKVQHSKLRTIMTVGGHPIFKTRTDGTSPAKDFIDTFNDVISGMQMGTKRSLPIYDKLVSVCRAQAKKLKTVTAPLTREEIAAALAPAKADPEEVAVLRRQQAGLRKLIKAWPDAEQCLENAAMALAPRLAYLEELEKSSALLKSIEAMPDDIRGPALEAYNKRMAELEAANTPSE